MPITSPPQGYKLYFSLFEKWELYLYTISKRHSRSSAIRIFYSLYAKTGWQEILSFFFRLIALHSCQNTLSRCVCPNSIYFCIQRTYIHQRRYLYSFTKITIEEVYDYARPYTFSFYPIIIFHAKHLLIIFRLSDDLLCIQFYR